MEYYNDRGVITKAGMLFLRRTGNLPPRGVSGNIMDSDYVAAHNAKLEAFRRAFEARQSVRDQALAKAKSQWQMRWAVYQLLIAALLLWMLLRYLKQRVARKAYEEMMINPPPIYMPDLRHEQPPWWHFQSFPIIIDISLSPESMRRLEKAFGSVTATHLDITQQMLQQYEAVRFNPTTDTIYLHYQEISNWLGRNRHLLLASAFALWYLSTIIERENGRGSVVYVDWSEVSQHDEFTIPAVFWRHRARHSASWVGSSKGVSCPGARA